MQFLSPSWWLIIVGVLLIAGSFAVMVKFNKSEVSKRLKWLVWSMRTLAIMLIVFFLAQPVFEVRSTELEKPHLYIAYDISGSMQLASDEVAQVKETISNQEDILKEKYDVTQVGFGQQVVINGEQSFQQATNYTALGKHIEAVKSDNRSQLLVVSDGIFNQGLNPLYDIGWNYPVHTIAVGDTSIKRDIFIQEIRSNKSVFKGNEVPVSVNVVAQLMQGETAKLVISENGKPLFEKKINIAKSSVVQDIAGAINLKTAGEHKIDVSIITNANEPKANNVGVFYVTVQETKKRIVCIADAPHPDIRMLVNAWKKIPEYEVTILNSFENIDTLTTSTIDLMVMHKPSFATWNKLSSQLKNVPTWWITGVSPDVSLWKSMPTGVTLNKASKQVNEISFAWNNATNVFNLTTEEIAQLSNSAPVQVPFGDFSTLPNTQTIAFQKVGNLQTNYPLISFNVVNGLKHGVWIGEGFWKWQLNTFIETEEQSAFEQLVLKYTRLLLTKENKKPLVCYAATSINEGEKWKLTANVFNASFEPTNEAVVKLNVTDSTGNKLVFDPIVNGNDYQFLVSGLAGGAYKYQVIATLNKNEYQTSGNVLVKTLNLEQFNTRADFMLLQAWSEKTGGQHVSVDEAETLISSIVANAPAIKTIANKEQKLLLDLWYILLIPALLLGGEWFIRKRNGMN